LLKSKCYEYGKCQQLNRSTLIIYLKKTNANVTVSGLCYNDISDLHFKKWGMWLIYVYIIL